MKKLITAVALACMASVSLAQLSDRENDRSTYKLGSRPQKGDLSLMFAINITQDGDSTGYKKINALRTGDLITGKYYFSDKVAGRVGFKIYKSGQTFKSEGDTVTGNGSLSEQKYVSSNREYVFKPGVEYHFSNSNLFDVYAGSDLYLGFQRKVSVDERTFEGGDFSNSKTITPSKKIGLSPFIGVQAFILDLPVSLGIEYGWDAVWTSGGIAKVETEVKSGNTTTTQEYQTVSDPSNANASGIFTKVNTNRSVIMNTNQNVRVVLNLYFGTKNNNAAAVAQLD